MWVLLHRFILVFVSNNLASLNLVSRGNTSHTSKILEPTTMPLVSTIPTYYMVLVSCPCVATKSRKITTHSKMCYRNKSYYTLIWYMDSFATTTISHDNALGKKRYKTKIMTRIMQWRKYIIVSHCWVVINNGEGTIDHDVDNEWRVCNYGQCNNVTPLFNDKYNWTSLKNDNVT
jgi:hypothetical protein